MSCGIILSRLCEFLPVLSFLLLSTGLVHQQPLPRWLILCKCIHQCSLRPRADLPSWYHEPLHLPGWLSLLDPSHSGALPGGPVLCSWNDPGIELLVGPVLSFGNFYASTMRCWLLLRESIHETSLRGRAVLPGGLYNSYALPSRLILPDHLVESSTLPSRKLLCCWSDSTHCLHCVCERSKVHDVGMQRHSGQAVLELLRVFFRTI